ncbi:MAG: hypothetical protein K2Y23_26580 [Cyanobacteria bacterium]|nr:hypothetical protein [Cyanobacteriota bacterium]
MSDVIRGSRNSRSMSSADPSVIHETQFTQRRPDITLPEQVDLLTPILESASYPPDVRLAIGDNLLGQHRLAWRQLWRQGRERLAVRAALGMLRYPDRLAASTRHRATGARSAALEGAIEIGHRVFDLSARARAALKDAGLRAALWPRRARYKLIGGGPPRALEGATHVWVDGTSLGREQTGYFSLLSEMIRRLLADGKYAVHVVATRHGRAALLGRLGHDQPRLRFHAAGWRALHWTDVFELLASPAVQIVALLIAALAITAGMMADRR